MFALPFLVCSLPSSAPNGAPFSTDDGESADVCTDFVEPSASFKASCPAWNQYPYGLTELLGTALPLPCVCSTAFVPETVPFPCQRAGPATTGFNKLPDGSEYDSPYIQRVQYELPQLKQQVWWWWWWWWPPALDVS